MRLRDSLDLSGVLKKGGQSPPFCLQITGTSYNNLWVSFATIAAGVVMLAIILLITTVFSSIGP